MSHSFFQAAAFGLVFLTAAAVAHASPDLPVPPAASAGIASKLVVRGELQGLQAVDLRAQRRNDILVVQAEVTNTQPRDLRLYYRFRWIDPNGMQVGDGEVWKPLVFLGLQTQTLKGTAYGPQATDFQIEMSAERR
jgi:uncharacterized protein YcfL